MQCPLVVVRLESFLHGTLRSANQAQTCTLGWTGDSGNEDGRSQRQLDTICKVSYSESSRREPTQGFGLPCL